MITKETTKKVNFSKLKEGSILSETQFYTVVRTKGDQVQLQNDQGEDIIVGKAYVESLLFSADQFTETKKITKTEVANIFLGNPNIALEVNFNKQIKEADVVKELLEAYQGSTIKTMESAIKGAVKKALNGEERTMRGRHNGHTDEFGRVHFIDMEVTKDTSKEYDIRHRLVDPRTINYLVLNGVKYVVK